MLTVLKRPEDIKVVSSINMDLSCAKKIMRYTIEKLEQEGWSKFGVMMPIYDKEVKQCIYIQIMTR